MACLQVKLCIAISERFEKCYRPSIERRFTKSRFTLLYFYHV